jgi:hypothetical protein
MALENPDIIGAAGSVGTNGTAVWAAGAVSARTGAGVYTLTLDAPADAADCSILVTPRTTAQIGCYVVHTSDTVKTVHALLVAVATDTAFDFAVIRKPAGY